MGDLSGLAFMEYETTEGEAIVYRSTVSNGRGERLRVRLTESEGPLSDRWAKDGLTPTRLRSWWTVETRIFDAEGNERDPLGLNPTTKARGNGRALEFDWVLEANDENAARVLCEAFSRFEARGKEAAL